MSCCLDVHCRSVYLCLFSCFLGGSFSRSKKQVLRVLAFRACVRACAVRVGFVDVRLRGMCSGVPAESLAPTPSPFFLPFEEVKVNVFTD